jgi:hypothetical protein
MQQQTISVSSMIEIRIANVPGNLRVAGWDRNEIMAKTDGDSLELTTHEDHVAISCDENLILYVPRTSSLVVESVVGDGSLQAMTGSAKMDQVAGNLTLKDIDGAVVGTVAGDVSVRNSGALELQSASGNFVLRNAKGDIQITTVGGDASLRNVEGAVIIKNVGSDFYLRNAQSSVNVTSGADAALYVVPQPDIEYRITAGDDLLVRLPPDANVELHLTSENKDAIHVDFPDITLDDEVDEQVITLGNGAAKMFLSAVDDLVVTSKSDRWQTAEDFGFGMDEFEFNIPEIPPIPSLPDDLGQRINERVQRAMERVQLKSEEVSRRAQRVRVHAEAASRRSDLKVEAAMRRAEAKARAAEHRARQAKVNMNVGRWKWDLTPGQFPPAPDAPHPVSDEERLTILRMLQEKKISLDDAEKLLSSLEGKVEGE